MKLIPLTKGKFAIVDDEDLDRLSGFRWMAVCLHGTWYAMRTTRGRDEKEVCRKMERNVIRETVPPRMCIDHINGDGLDNRKDNLRIVTYSQNSLNSRWHRERPAMESLNSASL